MAHPTDAPQIRKTPFRSKLPSNVLSNIHLLDAGQRR